MKVNDDGTADLFVWFTAHKGYVGILTNEEPDVFGQKYHGPYRVRIKLPEDIWNTYRFESDLEAEVTAINDNE